MTNSTQTSKTMHTRIPRTINLVTNIALVESTMPEILKRTVEQAMHLLAATKAEYIIRLPDGTLINEGTLVIKLSKKDKAPAKKRGLKMPYGTMRNAVMPYVECLKVGDVAEIGFTPEMLAAGVDSKDLLSSISNAAVKCFGKEAHKLCTNKKTGKVEILRTA